MRVQTERGSWLDRLWRGIFTVGYRTARLWWFVRRPEQHGAWVVLWCDDELLLIRNSYKSGDTVPCGGIGRGESPLDAARRELYEEVGIDVARERLVPTDHISLTHEHKFDHAHFFELHCDTRPLVRIDRREVVAAEFAPRRELLDRPLVPALRMYLERRLRAPARGDTDALS